MRKKAFTLAEVLITLGIIGVVAAMTLPTLIQKHHKNVVETRLKKFYSTINQAIMLAEKDYGDKANWAPKDTEEFWNIYLKPYLKYTSVEKRTYDSTALKNRVVYFPDGSATIFNIYFDDKEDTTAWQSTGGIFTFCPEAKYCSEGLIKEINKKGVEVFTFGFWPNETAKGSNFDYHRNKGVEPYLAWWHGEESDLYSNTYYGCNETASREYCTAIIQRNGWRIPDNYPFKF